MATPIQPAGLVSRIIPDWPARLRTGAPLPVGVLPGEGIGPEVIGPCLEALEVIGRRTGLRFDIRQGGAIGVAAWRATGQALTPEVVAFCEDVFAAGGAILCGPGGGRFVYDLRVRFDLFCKLVPLQPLAALLNTGVVRAEARRGVDVLVVRENTGGLYVGDGGTEPAPGGGTRSWHRFHYDQARVARILRVAVAAATARRGELCVVTKPGGVPGISQLWERTARELAAGTGVRLRILEIDTACYQLVADARSFDVVAAPNMFGDVLADGASLLLGSRGLSASANFAGNGAAVYQTGHGAAHDLAGRGTANPVGQLLSLAMMLAESFDQPRLAAALVAALDDTLRAGWRTADIAEAGCRVVGTRELGDHVAAALDARLAPAAAVAGLHD